MSMITIRMTPIRGVIEGEQLAVDLPVADACQAEYPYSAWQASHPRGHRMILLFETQNGVLAIL